MGCFELISVVVLMEVLEVFAQPGRFFFFGCFSVHLFRPLGIWGFVGAEVFYLRLRLMESWNSSFLIFKREGGKRQIIGLGIVKWKKGVLSLASFTYLVILGWCLRIESEMGIHH